MNKKDLIIYRVVTGIFSLMLGGGAIMYFVQYDAVAEVFTGLGVSTAVIYPLAVAKICGIIAIWFINIPWLKQLAYLGFAIDLVAAIIAHLIAQDGEFYGPMIPLVLLIVSYVYYKRINSKKES